MYPQREPSKVCREGVQAAEWENWFPSPALDVNQGKALFLLLLCFIFPSTLRGSESLEDYEPRGDFSRAQPGRS